MSEPRPNREAALGRSGRELRGIRHRHAGRHFWTRGGRSRDCLFSPFLPSQGELVMDKPRSSNDHHQQSRDCHDRRTVIPRHRPAWLRHQFRLRFAAGFKRVFGDHPVFVEPQELCRCADESAVKSASGQFVPASVLEGFQKVVLMRVAAAISSRDTPRNSRSRFRCSPKGDDDIRLEPETKKKYRRRSAECQS